MAPGTIIICVFNGAGISPMWPKELTTNKKYKLLEVHSSQFHTSDDDAAPIKFYRIKNDQNFTKLYPSELFKPLVEMRNEKLNEILSE